ncbi:MAG: lysine--tRNA ligase [Candidatus Aenigmarchaeota archaeon]|nr:lysine--tRNA ligase [Candidatus Aenigmarchaeota archaeon]
MSDVKSLFWADQLAIQVKERAKKENSMPVIRTAQTPSGGKHIGNLNDVLRAHFVYKSLRDSGKKARFVHTHDDRDPMKDIPGRIADLDAKWYSAEQFPEMQKYIGVPYYMVPDPFGCCKSFSDHFSKLWIKGLEMIDVYPEHISTNALYEAGKFEPYIQKTFEKIQDASRILAKFQSTKEEGYIPFDAICPNCNILSNVSSFDLEQKTVTFTCGGKTMKKKTSEGCGQTATVPWSHGKLQWRFEWPAQWGIFKTTFEPFGKDHYEGSWKSGQDISRIVFNEEPPIPYVYEFFLVNGEKMSASKGNVYITQDMMKLLEAEVFMFFYTKRPGMQRDLDLKNIFRLIDDFESAENVYFGKEAKIKTDEENMKRSYEMCFDSVPKIQPLRIDYKFAALIAQAGGDTDRAIELLKFTGHIKDEIKKEDREKIEKRLELAKFWAQNFADPQLKIIINEKIPSVDLSHHQRKAIKELLDELIKDKSESELQLAVFNIARANNMEPKEFFKLLYQLLISKDSGPRLGAFVIAVGKKRVIELLDQV